MRDLDLILFDLSNDASPTVTVLIATQEAPEPRQYYLVVPFNTSSVIAANENVVWGSDEVSGWIGLLARPGTDGYVGATLQPAFDVAPEASGLGGPDIVTSDSGALYLVRDGLNRNLLYRFPDAGDRGEDWRSDMQIFGASLPSLVAVNMPKKFEPIEVGGSGRFANIPQLDQDGQLRYFEGRSARAGQDWLDIRYQVPPTFGQQFLLGILTKLAGTLIGPFVLFLVKAQPFKVSNSWIRRLATGVVVFQVMMLIGIGYLILGTGADLTPDKLVDLVTATVAAILGGLFAIVEARKANGGSLAGGGATASTANP